MVTLMEASKNVQTCKLAVQNAEAALEEAQAQLAQAVAQTEAYVVAETAEREAEDATRRQRPAGGTESEPLRANSGRAKIGDESLKKIVDAEADVRSGAAGSVSMQPFKIQLSDAL
jgi:Tfp pilus assembly protein PilX